MCIRDSASTLPEVAAYPLRAAQLFLGDDLRVLGAQIRRDGDVGPDSAGAALLGSPSGVSAQLAFGLEHAYRSGYSLWGSEGHLRLERAFSTPDELVPVVRIERQNQVTEVPLAADRQFVNIAGEFARAVLDGEDFGPHYEAVLRQAELVDAMDRAAARYSERPTRSAPRLKNCTSTWENGSRRAPNFDFVLRMPRATARTRPC